jgi:hypothetical protein
MLILCKDKELTSTDEEDEQPTETQEETPEQARDPCPVAEYLLKQLIEIRLLHDKKPNNEFRSSNDFKIFEQSMGDLQEVCLFV